MDKKQMNKLRMFRVVQAVCNKQADVAGTVPAFVAAIGDLGNVIEKVESLQALHTTDHKGVTRDSNHIGEQLVEAILAVSGALHALGTDQANHTLVEKVNYTRSSFKKFQQSRRIAEGVTVLAEAKNRTAELVPAYLTEAIISQLETLLNEYRDAYTRPREVRVNKTTVTASLREAMKEGGNILTNRADRLAVQFRDTYPDFYQAYLKARIIEDLGTRHENGGNGEQAPVAEFAQTTDPAMNK